MFDFIRNNKKITQIFLALITLPFAFWGVDSYVRNAEVGAGVATVGGAKITRQELQSAMREQEDRMRAQLGGKVDPAMFETPQMRRAVLDSLVTQRLLAEQTQKARLTVGNEQLVQFIASVPSLQENGKFSKERYEALVAAQGMSKEMFEARLRQDMAMQQLMLPVIEAGITGQVAASRWLATQVEQREIAEARLMPEAYAGRVKLAADAVQKYYEANRSKFELPEQVRAEFLVLSRDAMIMQASVSDEEARAAYQSRADRYKEAETRRASHILIRAAKDAPEAEAKAAKAKAEELLLQVKKTPADFARIAKQNSQDPGSAEKGGDLDWFGRGAMVKAFEDTAFALKEGQISDVVRSDFGFHVIRVTGVRAERSKPFDEVKAELLAELKREAGMKKYAEAAEAFGNTVYEQSDSLKPAAEKWKLEIRQSQWLAKGSKLAPPFDNPKLAAALFSDDGLKNKRNSEAVEAAPGALVSARVLEHKPAALQPLEVVKGDIEKYLVREEAFKLATKDGEETLARLAKGEAVDLKWSPARNVSRTAAQGLPADSLRAVFKADTGKLPAYAGVAVPNNGYALYRIGAVKRIGEVDKNDPLGRALAQQYARFIAEEEFSAWMSTLKEKYPVEINKAALESKDR
ncbi:SurA N-terminal domain-containing protein [Sulfuritalea hydrogenivorans]|uniref:Periplasmic chaperone PpiD n=1 Tax=Sulfuritalea hydrogenivorans sk43H TaxID=1223802 RepID=W0SGZ6_9PROT|nr:SurA N-terminal domain-containing protein [Sulfuritalea hydrogenivorans]MDK9712930.1 SurA N-terminal domain-containing protein [Sulfuritalea sp.]BAO30237.1 PpiC-type peptidyl-prolyl cis-trans isomerase [Sulfuritalea hydrogenivorans sk43H]